MPTRVIISAVIFALLISSRVLAVTQIQEGHTIRGKVRNSAGYNMAHVTVDLEAGNGPLIQQTVTNSEGDFYFSNLAETSYAVVVAAPDYEVVSERVDFFRQAANAPGETRMVEITLVPKAGARATRPGLNFVQNIPKAAQSSYESALRLSKEGKKEDAIARLQEAIRIFPDYFNAHFVLATELMKTGKLGDAIAQLEAARRINPKDDRIYELFGLVLMQQKKYAVAAAVFAEAARLNGLDPQYPLMRGIALIDYAALISPDASKNAVADRNTALSDAEKNLKHAYELSNGKLAIVHLHLARVYEKKGDRSHAASELEEYLHENPNAENARAIREAIKKLRS